MKKLLAIIAILGIYTNANAQTKVVVRNNNTNIESPFVSRLEVVANINTGSYKKAIDVKVTVDKDAKKGTVVSFTSTVPIDKVEVTRNKNGVTDLQTTDFSSGNVTSYEFLFDTGAYSGGDEYRLNFYVKGSPLRVWVTDIKKIKPVINKVPKKIPTK